MTATATAGRLCALVAAANLCARATVDPDLWGHLRFGLDVLATGGLTAVDPYSFTQDAAWINHEWLSEVLFAAAFAAGGVLGLLLLKTAILGTAAWLLAGVARRATPGVRWWLLAVALVGLTPAATTIRPQLWTILGLAALSRLLVADAPLAWTIPLFALWANLHGGWIVGAGVAAWWLIGRRALAPALTLAVAMAATIVNPYGWRLWAFLLSTVRMSRNITEWRPLWEQPDWSHGALWLGVVTLTGVTLIRRRREIVWAFWLPALWLGVSGLFVDRLTPLFAEMALLALATAWARGGAVDRERSPGIANGEEREDRTHASAVTTSGSRPREQLVVDAIAIAVVWLALAMGPARCLPIDGDWKPDLSAASALNDPSVHGRLVLPFNWGEYALWHWGPRLRVSMDGRRETIYTEHTVDEQVAVAAGEPEGLAFLERTRPEYVWLPTATSQRTLAWLRAHDYRVDVQTPDSFVAARADLPVLQAGAAMSRCFP